MANDISHYAGGLARIVPRIGRYPLNFIDGIEISRRNDGSTFLNRCLPLIVREFQHLEAASKVPANRTASIDPDLIVPGHPVQMCNAHL